MVAACLRASSGVDAAIGPDLEDQLVIVRELTHAGVLHNLTTESKSIGMTPIAWSSFLFCSPG
jgi:hypothetical protein